MGDRIRIDGAEAVTVTTSMDTQNAWLAQYYVNHGGQLYILTFSFGPETPEADRTAIIDGVLTSWTWA